MPAAVSWERALLPLSFQYRAIIASRRRLIARLPGRARALITQKIHQGLDRWAHLAAARIIKKKSCRRSWRPLVENGHKSALGKIRCDEEGRALYEPKAFDGGTACDRH